MPHLHLPVHTHAIPSPSRNSKSPPANQGLKRLLPPLPPPWLLGVEEPLSCAVILPFYTTAPAELSHQHMQAGCRGGVCKLPEQSSFNENNVWILEQAAHLHILFLERSSLAWCQRKTICGRRHRRKWKNKTWKWNAYKFSENNKFVTSSSMHKYPTLHY